MIICESFLAFLTLRFLMNMSPRRYDNEIAELVVEDPDMSAAEVAKELVNAAVPLMQQKDVVSPFSSRASDEGGSLGHPRFRAPQSH